MRREVGATRQSRSRRERADLPAEESPSGTSPGSARAVPPLLHAKSSAGRRTPVEIVEREKAQTAAVDRLKKVSNSSRVTLPLPSRSARSEEQGTEGAGPGRAQSRNRPPFNSPSWSRSSSGKVAGRPGIAGGNRTVAVLVQGGCVSISSRISLHHGLAEPAVAAARSVALHEDVRQHREPLRVVGPDLLEKRRARRARAGSGTFRDGGSSALAEAARAATVSAARPAARKARRDLLGRRPVARRIAVTDMAVVSCTVAAKSRLHTLEDRLDQVASFLHLERGRPVCLAWLRHTIVNLSSSILKIPTCFLPSLCPFLMSKSIVLGDFESSNLYSPPRSTSPLMTLL